MTAEATREAAPRGEGVETGIPTLRAFGWSVGRELRENRSVYLAPLGVAAVFLVGFIVSLVGLPERMRAASAVGAAQLHESIQQPYVIVAIILMAVGLVVAAVYSLDALYGERRDRSILFWKSLPVSDLTTVLAKASVPIVVIPLVTFVVTVVTQLVMLLASTAALAIGGQSAAQLWMHVPILELLGTNFVHLVGFHGLWYAPLYGWLLLASAWAKRAPLLWGVLPPVAIGALEKIALGSSRFATLVQERVLGGPMPESSAGGMTMEMLGSGSPGSILVRPGLWIGFAVTAVFLYAAVRLYRARGPR